MNSIQDNFLKFLNIIFHYRLLGENFLDNFYILKKILGAFSFDLNFINEENRNFSLLNEGHSASILIRQHRIINLILQVLDLSYIDKNKLFNKIFISCSNYLTDQQLEIFLSKNISFTHKNSEFGGSLVYEFLIYGRKSAANVISDCNFFNQNDLFSTKFEIAITNAIKNLILKNKKDILDVLDEVKYRNEVKSLCSNYFFDGYMYWVYIAHILIRYKKIEIFRAFINKLNILKIIPTADFTMNAKIRPFLYKAFDEQSNIEYFSKRILQFSISHNCEKNIQAFKNVFAILGNVSLCCEILSELDLDIINLVKKRKSINYAMHKPSSYISSQENLLFPGKWNEEFQTSIKKESLLSLLLLKYEQKHDINTQASKLGEDVYPVPCFSGFINPSDAINVMKNGHLFSEYSMLGNTILHGKYTHRLQWYILIKAYEKNLLDLKGLTIKELLVESISSKKYGFVPWAYLFDSIRIRDRFGFYCVNGANSFLLTTTDERLQQLRGYLLLNFWSSVKKINYFAPSLTYEEIILLSVSSYRNLDILRHLIDAKYIPSSHHLQRDNGIIWKKNKVSLPKIISETKSVKYKINQSTQTIDSNDAIHTCEINDDVGLYSVTKKSFNNESSIDQYCNKEDLGGSKQYFYPCKLEEITMDVNEQSNSSFLFFQLIKKSIMCCCKTRRKFVSPKL